MCTTIGASGRDCVYYVAVTLSDLFQPNDWFYGLTSFKVIFLGGPICLLPSINLHIGRRANPILIKLNKILKQPI